ncbi:alpha/beta fold hydrolase [Rossellomorea aquimaris]|uniref:alpha/beta fold hydrolase n=1 Tax=Rossellomorea aquimaris TaxID=189382 RepID=UPI001CD3E4FF|nr:alpha/beta fold hydrolase [Rossellomorea aquimaris]MCA1054090.1 alpha/beta fold hydrolase [Rossellomorea aquimaris]
MNNLKNGEFYIPLNGIRHWIKIEGSEHATIPLVVLHGGPGGNHYVFERTAGPLLAKARTVIYYEQRGCGRSEKPQSDEAYTIPELIDDFIELKEWLGVKKVDLLGYSFGGEFALELASVIPNEINQLVVSGPSLMNDEIQKMVQITGFMTVAKPSIQKEINDLHLDNKSLDEIHGRLWQLADTDTVDALLFENKQIAVQNRKLWEESKLTNTGLMMNALTNHPIEVPLLSRLEKIKNQTLILTGAFDRNTGVPISSIIHRQLENSSLVLFEKSAHFPDLEETEKFVSVIVAFLKCQK